MIEKFGSDGYLVFFGTLELMADEFDIEEPGKTQLSIKKLTKNLQLSRQKTLKILKFCDEKERIFCNVNKNSIALHCPRLQELTDEYTQKMLKQKSGQTPAVNRDKLRPKEEEVEEEVEEEKKYIKKKRFNLKEFEIFYQAYPNHKDKAKALERWKAKSNKNRLPGIEIILNAIEKQKLSKAWDDERFIPLPSTWINKERWEDEIEERKRYT